MPRCEVCQYAIDLRAAVTSLSRGRRARCQILTVAGERRIVECRWLCPICEADAARLARQPPQAEDPPPQVG